jgi:hypothetical protein
MRGNIMLNNKIYHNGEAIAAFKYTGDAIDYIENESWGYEEGLTIIDDNNRTFIYLNGEIVK